MSSACTSSMAKVVGIDVLPMPEITFDKRDVVPIVLWKGRYGSLLRARKVSLRPCGPFDAN